MLTLVLNCMLFATRTYKLQMGTVVTKNIISFLPRGENVDHRSHDLILSKFLI